MSKPIQRGPLKVIEIDLEPEDEESAQEVAHTESRAIIDTMCGEKMRLPVQVASLAVNAEGCLYRDRHRENYRRRPHNVELIQGTWVRQSRCSRRDPP
jgi:hypothetical protein